MRWETNPGRLAGPGKKVVSEGRKEGAAMLSAADETNKMKIEFATGFGYMKVPAQARSG